MFSSTICGSGARHRVALLGLAVFTAACNEPNGAPNDDMEDTDAVVTGGVDTSGESTDGETETDGGEDVPFDPIPGGLRRLLADEYVESVRLLLGEDAAAAADPPEDQSKLGFYAIAARDEAFPILYIDRYEASAAAVAQATVASTATLAGHAPCVDAGDPNAACYGEVAQRLGALAWRRPLTEAEVADLREVGSAGRTVFDGEFDAGLRYVLMAILQSPNFLYLVEIGEEREDGTRELTGPELATRLSFFLLGHTPTSEILSAAHAGALDSEDGIRGLAVQMLEDPAAPKALDRFFDELYRLDDIEHAGDKSGVYPDFDDALIASMRLETLLLLRDVIWNREAAFSEVLTADYTFVDGELAGIYGVEVSDPSTFSRVELPADQRRAGVLTQAAILTRYSHPEKNSPTKRGQFVQERFLCTTVDPPPVGVDAVLPEEVGDQTLREWLEQHRDAPACAACHAVTDPIGFALEHYNPVGAFRNKDRGKPIDASGDLAGVGTWEDARGLAQALAENEKLPDCLVEKMVRGKLGHVDEAGLGAELERVQDAFAASDQNVKQLLVEFVASPLFRRLEEPK